ncbi:hypothetical protein Tco_1336420 [Tanacetum coccineum]
MQDMSKDGLIPSFDMDTGKCKTCMLTKITKKPFQNVKRETEVLEMIHSDLCDLHATPSLRNNQYFVTFIDDASRTPNPGIYAAGLRCSEASCKIPDPKLKILGERGIECIFIGYDEHSKSFRFYVIEPNESVSINSIIESRDAIFDENRFSSVPRPSQRESSALNGKYLDAQATQMAQELLPNNNVFWVSQIWNKAIPSKSIRNDKLFVVALWMNTSHMEEIVVVVPTSVGTSFFIVNWACGFPKSDQWSDISSGSIGYGSVLVSLDMGYMASVVYIGSGFVILSDLSSVKKLQPSIAWVSFGTSASVSYSLGMHSGGYKGSVCMGQFGSKLICAQFGSKFQ